MSVPPKYQVDRKLIIRDLTMETVKRNAAIKAEDLPARLRHMTRIDALLDRLLEADPPN